LTVLETGEKINPAPILAMHYVYVIQSKTTYELYIGSSSNLKNRLVQHNANKSRSTKGKGLWILIYTEVYRSKDDALTREIRLKYHGRTLAQLKKRLINSLLKPE
jgi:putative endonuclease